MVPWEGVTDLYRELAFHGGIPETKFVPVWFKRRIEGGRNRKFPLADDFLAKTEAHPLDDAYWASKRPVLENIEIPALVCANWSDHGLHMRPASFLLLLLSPLFAQERSTDDPEAPAPDADRVAYRTGFLTLHSSVTQP
jgi:predicted acyl esterase